MSFVFYAVVSFISYLLLTIDSGNFFILWSKEELIAGVVVSLIIAATAHKLVPLKIGKETANPLKWFAFFIYFCIPFLFSLIVANVEVAFRVLTGRIKPAVVKLDPELESQLGTFFLANSITLSPGTLSTEMDDEDNSIYIHCLNWTKKKGEPFRPKEVAPFIHFWLKKIFK